MGRWNNPPHNFKPDYFLPCCRCCCCCCCCTAVVPVGPRTGHSMSVTPGHETVVCTSARFQRIPLPACSSSSSLSVSYSLGATGAQSLLLAEMEILYVWPGFCFAGNLFSSTVKSHFSLTYPRLDAMWLYMGYMVTSIQSYFLVSI
jgi:hypothetical protein